MTFKLSGSSSPILTIARRETSVFFNTPIAYVVLVCFLLLTGWFFSGPLFLNNLASLSHLFNIFPLLSCFLVPAMTMRLLAEERKLGTYEVLTTLPVKTHEIVIGKFLAGSVFFLANAAPVFVYAITVLFLGPLDIGQTISGFIGLFLMGGLFVSIGLFASALTKNQIVAFILGFLFCFGLFICGFAADILPKGIRGVVNFLGVTGHFQTFAQGIFDLKDFLYFTGLTALFLQATTGILMIRKE